jgi:hypothetical protein
MATYMVLGMNADGEKDLLGIYLAPLLRQLEYFEKAVLARYNLISDENDVLIVLHLRNHTQTLFNQQKAY